MRPDPIRSLPTTSFSTDQLVGEARFEAWRSSISVLFDVAPLSGTELDGFSAAINGYHLGSLLIADHHFSAQQFSRTLARAAHDGLDHYLVQWYLDGGFIGRRDGEPDMKLPSGSITVLELQRPVHTIAQASKVLSLVVPRALLQEALGGSAAAGRTSLHCCVLPTASALGGLLADHLQSLLIRSPTLAVADTSAVAHATTQMLAACLRPSVRTLAEAEAGLRAAALGRIRQHIAGNLGTPLSPEGLARTFGLSRSQLYRLFEPLGGVTHYVQHQRLLRAFHALATPATSRHLRVADIAARLGFVSEAHFSRAFRATFGLTPSDARAQGAAGRAYAAAASVPGAEYADWVRGLHVPLHVR